MKAKDFPFDEFREHYEKTQKKLLDFESNKERGLILCQRPAAKHFDVASHTKEDSLEAQLDCFKMSLELHSDLCYNYLTPWHGVGVYAAAFGCPTVLYEHTSLQTLYKYNTIDDLPEVLDYPDIRKSKYLMMILESIEYFREQTKDRIPISMTDTQSPNDTASLILDSCEMFAASIEEPERLQDLLTKVTDLIIEFSDMQIQAIGEGNVASYGHQMFSDPSFRGIALSDDNMAVISPDSYSATSLEFIKRLAAHYNGVAMHSCGVFVHNLPALMEIEGLKVMECAVGYGDPGFPVDPGPNDAAVLAPYFMDKDITLKVRLGPGELERVFPLLDSRIKLQIDLITHGTVEERNLQYDRAKDILLAHYR